MDRAITNQVLVGRKRPLSTSRSPLLEIDGSKGEGGGQIIRNAAAYAAIFQNRNLRLFNIRAKRTQQGLKRQHLVALELLTKASGANLIGGTVGSTDVTIEFNNLEEESPQTSQDQMLLVGDTQTAGSICLLLQAIIPFALFAANRDIQWTLKGGTNATMAPQYDYFEQVFLPTLQLAGLPVEVIQSQVIRHGYYPKGRGEVVVHTTPLSSPLKPIVLQDRGQIVSISIEAFHGGNCPKHVAERMAKAAHSHMQKNHPDIPIQNKQVVFHPSTMGAGSGILLVAETETGCKLAGSALGSRKESPQHTGRQAAQELCSTLQDGGCVDEYLQDQLILYMALAKGRSEILTGSLTLHTQSAISIAEQLCGISFQVERLLLDHETTITTTTIGKVEAGEDGRIRGRHRISCNGIGFTTSKDASEATAAATLGEGTAVPS